MHALLRPLLAMSLMALAASPAWSAPRLPAVPLEEVASWLITAERGSGAAELATQLFRSTSGARNAQTLAQLLSEDRYAPLAQELTQHLHVQNTVESSRIWNVFSKGEGAEISKRLLGRPCENPADLNALMLALDKPKNKALAERAHALLNQADSGELSLVALQKYAQDSRSLHLFGKYMSAESPSASQLGRERFASPQPTRLPGAPEGQGVDYNLVPWPLPTRGMQRAQIAEASQRQFEEVSQAVAKWSSDHGLGGKIRVVSSGAMTGMVRVQIDPQAVTDAQVRQMAKDLSSLVEGVALSF